jgi:hypothetical protein
MSSPQTEHSGKKAACRPQEISAMVTSEELDSYAVLGLPPESSVREVKVRFRLLAKRFHPDLNPGSEWHQEQFRRIHTAYEVIDRVHRTDASAAAHGEQTTPKPDSSPGHSSEAAWVHVGEASYVSDPPFASETGTTHRRRSVVWRRRRFSQPGLITGGLAAVALFLIAFIMAEPHNQGAYAASGIALNSSLPLSTPDMLPSSTLLGSPDASVDSGMSQNGSGMTAYSSTDVASAPQRGPYDVSAPSTGVPSAASNNEFSVDARYTQIDPTYTAVDPQYTTVDVQTPGDIQAIGVDPKNTGIDPQLIRP